MLAPRFSEPLDHSLRQIEIGSWGDQDWIGESFRSQMLPAEKAGEHPIPIDILLKDK